MSADEVLKNEDLSNVTEPVAERLERGLVLSVVASHIEPITRFDASDLSDSIPEESIQVPVELTLTQQLSFLAATKAGKGALACDTVESSTIFRDALDKKLLKAIKEAPAVIKNWVSADSAAYRRMMPAQSGFLEQPEPIGYEFTCNGCHGACKVVCMSCGGKGVNPCFDCSSSGKISCYHCKGAKRISCSNCYGRGRWTESEYKNVWNSYTNSYEYITFTVQKSCNFCDYQSGYTQCYKCDSLGKISCPACSGNGELGCRPCARTGEVDCNQCDATGILNESGIIVANVEQNEMLNIDTEDSKLESLVRAKIQLQDLPNYGQLLDVNHDLVDLTLKTQYQLRLEVLRAKISASEKVFLIYGFGPQSTVFSFDNVAGHMLEGDLVTLEKKVDSASRWRRYSGVDLLDVTADFLRSELNMCIAEKVTESKSTIQAAAKEVETNFHGLVEASYVERTSSALKIALSRLYSSQLFENGMYLCLLVGLTNALVYVLGPSVFRLIDFNRGYTFFITLLIGCFVWLILEKLTVSRISSRFDPNFAKRVVKQLDAGNTIRNWRIGVGLSLFFSTYVFLVAVDSLPFIQNTKAEHREAANSIQVLNRWFVPTPTDFRQRDYPSKNWLESQANAGELRAQIVLGLQLLLGADGMKRDINKAKYWIETAQVKNSKSNYVLLGKTMLALHQESTPEELISASGQLKELADSSSDFVEARYWEARTKLDDRSSTYDLAAGLAALAKAADEKHAHAALLMGENYAYGKNVRQNSYKAKHYLEIAAAEGLAEANQLLKTLK